MYRLLAAVTFLVLFSNLFAADWPCYRGPNGNGISAETGLNKNWAAKPPKKVWTAAMTDKGFAGFSVAAGKVYIIDHKDKQDIVRAINLADGANVWSYPYAETSEENYGFARSTPTVDNGKVYTISRQGIVNCLDAQTGAKVWTRNICTDFKVTRRPGWDYAASVFIDGEKAIVCPGGADATVAALNKLTGETIWKGGGSDRAGYATPVLATLDGKRQYVIFAANNLLGVDTGAGQLLSSLPWKTDWEVNAATPAVFDNSIFITSGYGRGCALVDVTGNPPKFAGKIKRSSPA